MPCRQHSCCRLVQLLLRNAQRLRPEHLPPGLCERDEGVAAIVGPCRARGGRMRCSGLLECSSGFPRRNVHPGTRQGWSV